jgi:hypothetical protein
MSAVLSSRNGIDRVDPKPAAPQFRTYAVIVGGGRRSTRQIDDLVTALRAGCTDAVRRALVKLTLAQLANL